MKSFEEAAREADAARRELVDELERPLRWLLDRLVALISKLKGERPL